MDGTQQDHAAVGLVLRRPVRTLGIEEFYTSFMSGVEEVLAAREKPLVLQVVPDLASELDAYRRWSEGGRVDGVILVDLLEHDDPRPALVRELGIHSVMLTPHPAPPGQSAVSVDERSPMLEIVQHLTTLGHRTIGRVSGPTDFAHTSSRSEAFRSACDAVGAIGVLAEGDYTAEGGRSATDLLLSAVPTPTALVFDNDVMAVAAVSHLRALNLDVPGDVSIIAWDDSVACRVATPPIAALRRDIHGLGEQVATTLLAVVESGLPLISPAETAHLVHRASTNAPHS
ncbi:substrate-binding domain-containing protein [Tessaracoccus lubricantis]|uniref:Substrate-binding domain-containing protein n=1 Tax=Tessaracoccus lubricantis TaxID=545543 RepID=A0ABP9EZ94_9ACTN